MRYLLDTNVISELVKKKPHRGVLRWIDERDESNLYLSVMDSLIAATALAHNLIVVTRNVKDIERCHASVFNPWEHE